MWTFLVDFLELFTLCSTLYGCDYVHPYFMCCSCFIHWHCLPAHKSLYEEKQTFPMNFCACALQNWNLIKLKSRTMRLIARSWPKTVRYWVKGFLGIPSTDCEYPIMYNYLHKPNSTFSHAWFNFGYDLLMQILISNSGRPHSGWKCFCSCWLIDVTEVDS